MCSQGPWGWGPAAVSPGEGLQSPASRIQTREGPAVGSGPRGTSGWARLAPAPVSAGQGPQHPPLDHTWPGPGGLLMGVLVFPARGEEAEALQVECVPRSPERWAFTPGGRWPRGGQACSAEPGLLGPAAPAWPCGLVSSQARGRPLEVPSTAGVRVKNDADKFPFRGQWGSYGVLVLPSIPCAPGPEQCGGTRPGPSPSSLEPAGLGGWAGLICP